MKNLVALALKFRVLVLGVAVAIVSLSFVQLPTANVDQLPEFAPPHVQIQTEALGLSAAEVEQLITVPIEHDLLNGVAWLDQIRSESTPGLSSIDLIFEPGTDPLKARQAVQERMAQAFALPPVGSPPVIVPPTASASRVMMVGLSAKDLSLIDLSILARWKIKPRLMAVPGVANVTIWGQRDKQLQVQVDPARLHQNGITLTDIITTTGNALWASPLSFVEASTPGTGGFVDMANQRLSIQHVLPITTADSLASVTITDDKGRTLRLSQVANVVEDHQPLIGDAVVSGGPGLMLVIEKFPGANTRDVTGGVKEALNALRPGLSGVVIDDGVYDAQRYIDSVMRNLGLWTILGALLLIVVLGLALFAWRAVFIAVVSIFLSLITALYLLYVLGTPFNLMILAGLAVALGVVIDDSLHDLKRFQAALQQSGARSETESAVAGLASAARAAGTPRVFATVIVLLAPLPLLFIGGVAESFARPLVLAYIVTVVTSSLVAVTVAPCLAFLLLRNGPPSGSPPIERLFRPLFDGTAGWFVARPALALVAAGAMALAVIAAVPNTSRQSLLPVPHDRSLVVEWQAAAGTSLSEMSRVTTQATTELAAIDGVRDVGANMGRAIGSDQIVNVDTGQIWVTLDESADYDASVSSIKAVLGHYPGLSSRIVTYPQEKVRSVSSGPTDSLVVRVYGVDFGVLQQKAEELGKAMAGIDGVVDPRVVTPAHQPSLEVEVNLLAAQKYGLNPGDVRRTATTYFSGLTVGQLYEDQAVFDVVVKGTPAATATADSLANLLIDTPSGGQVRLGDVASVRLVTAPTRITHDSTLRSVDITASVSGRNLDQVVNDVRALVASTPMPLEYHAEVLSGPIQAEAVWLQLLGLAVAVAVVILLLLHAALDSWRKAGLVFVTIPIATAGGVLAAIPGGGLSSLGGLIGFLTVLGVAAHNGLGLVRALGQISGPGEYPNPLAVLDVVREQSGPILVTGVATIALIAPALFVGGAGSDLLRPFASVVAGGIVTSTLLALFILPPLYLLIAPRSRQELAVAPAMGQ